MLKTRLIPGYYQLVLLREDGCHAYHSKSKRRLKRNTPLHKLHTADMKSYILKDNKRFQNLHRTEYHLFTRCLLLNSGTATKAVTSQGYLHIHASVLELQTKSRFSRPAYPYKDESHWSKNTATVSSQTKKIDRFTNESSRIVSILFFSVRSLDRTSKVES